MTAAADQLRRAQAAARREALELAFLQQLRAAGLEAGLCREHLWHPVRKWRFDFAYPGVLLAIEVEGLTHDGGRHQRMAGYQRDCEKYNAAALAGWCVLRYPGALVRNGLALVEVKRALLERSSVMPSWHKERGE